MNATLIVALIALAYLLGLASERVAKAIARANDRAVAGMVYSAGVRPHAVTVDEPLTYTEHVAETLRVVDGTAAPLQGGDAS